MHRRQDCRACRPELKEVTIAMNNTNKKTRLRSTFGAGLGALILAGCASTMPDGPSAGSATGEGGSTSSTVGLSIARPPAGEPAVAPRVPTAAVAAAAAIPAPAAASAPAAVPMPVDPLRPDVKVDLDAAAAHADLWVRVRRGFAMPDLDNDLVHDREQWYAARPDYVARMTGRSGRYLFHIIEEIERRNMPTELALLPFVESAFNPQAMSTAKASGMWQFIPSTGRDFLLRQNIFRDDRRDVLASTRAALDYLSKLHGMFGDWHLALAAYNWGEGSVQRAIDRNQKAGLPTDYASLRMPDETRLYVPKLQAVKNLVARPESFGLALPAIANHPYFLSVPIDRDIDVDMAVHLAGVTLEEFRTLNPQMNKPVILAAGTPQLLLPYDNANQFVKRLALHRGPLATWTAWVAPRTLRPSDAAREVGMSEEELRAVNRIPFRMLVKAGSTLLVPRVDNAGDDVSGEIADNASMALTPEVIAAARRVPPRTSRREPTPVAVVAAPLRGRSPAAGAKRPTAVAAAAGGRRGTVVAAGTARMLTLSPAGRSFVALPAPRAGAAAPAAHAAKPAAGPVRVAGGGGAKAAAPAAARSGKPAPAAGPTHRVALGGR